MGQSETASDPSFMPSVSRYGEATEPQSRWSLPNTRGADIFPEDSIELYKDIVFKVLPLTYSDAISMIGEIKGKKLLEGFRNYPVVDLDKLASIIVQFSKMIEENPEIIEVD